MLCVTIRMALTIFVAMFIIGTTSTTIAVAIAIAIAIATAIAVDILIANVDDHSQNN